MNLYEYVLSNPLLFSDVFGLLSSTEKKALMSALDLKIGRVFVSDSDVFVSDLSFPKRATDWAGGEFLNEAGTQMMMDLGLECAKLAWNTAAKLIGGPVRTGTLVINLVGKIENAGVEDKAGKFEELIQEKLDEYLEDKELFGKRVDDVFATKKMVETATQENVDEAYAEYTVIYNTEDDTFQIVVQGTVGESVRTEIRGAKHEHDRFCDLRDFAVILSGEVDDWNNTFDLSVSDLEYEWGIDKAHGEDWPLPEELVGEEEQQE
jgi:hypothetical protein